MTSQSSPKVVFQQAMEIADPQERAAFLKRVCEGNDGLRREVESLLFAYMAAGSFLEGSRFSPRELPSEKPGDRIGRYQLIQPIGEGGFGRVWMAEQQEPMRRSVALKIIKLGMDTGEVLARFEAERQALALMDHPNIARVFDGGATDSGRPYFVMELVRGQPITEFCDARRMTPTERLELFRKVCLAVQHAHQKGIIHRDLKPSNILVTVEDDVLVPKIIDFGISKALQSQLTGQTAFTRFNQWLGTPAYMSPEQAGLGGLDVDTRSDVYSLGTILYELLTGHTPFDELTLRERGYEAILRIIREEDPPKPSTRLSALPPQELETAALHRGRPPEKLAHAIKGELDWILLKSLERDRSRRYESASALGKDLERYCTGEPVGAVPPSFGYRLGKLARRHRRSAALVISIASMLMVTAVFSTVMALYAGRQKERAVRAENFAKDNLYAADMSLAHLAVENGQFPHALELLRGHMPEPGQPDRRGLEWRYLWYRCKGEQLAIIQLPGSGAVNDLAVTPDDRFIVVARGGGQIQVVRYDDFKPVFTTEAFESTPGPCSVVAISPDGHTVAVTGNDSREAAVWRLDKEGTLTLVRRIPVNKPFSAAFARDGRTLAIGTEVRHSEVHVTDGGVTKLFDVESGREIATLPESGGRAVAFSPDGKWLVTGPANGDVDLKIWERSGLKLARTLRGERASWAVFSGDSRLLFSNSGRVPTCFWLPAFTKVSFPRGDLNSFWTRGAISPDGRFAAAFADHAIALHEVGTGRMIRLDGHAGGSRCVIFSHGGKLLVSGGVLGELRVWNVNEQKGYVRLRQKTVISRFLPLPPSSPDGERLALYIEKDAVVVNGASGMVGPVLERESAYPLAFLDDNTLMLIRVLRFRDASPPAPSGTEGGRDSTELLFWNLTTGKVDAASFEAVGNDSISAVAVSPDRQLVVIASTGEVSNRITVVDTATKRIKYTASGFEHQINGMACSFDNRRLAVAMESGEVWIHEPPLREAVQKFSLPGDVAECPAFSPDGRLLAVSGRSTVRLWSLPEGKEVKIANDVAHPRHVRFSEDGRTLIAYGDNETKLWHLPTGREMFSLKNQYLRLLQPLSGERFCSRTESGLADVEVFGLPPLERAEEWLDTQPATLTEARGLLPPNPEKVHK